MSVKRPGSRAFRPDAPQCVLGPKLISILVCVFLMAYIAVVDGNEGRTRHSSTVVHCAQRQVQSCHLEKTQYSIMSKQSFQIFYLQQ